MSYGFDLCSRYFANVVVRDEHFKTKQHKKRDASFNFAFGSRHVSELNELPNDGCQVPRSGQEKVNQKQKIAKKMTQNSDNAYVNQCLEMVMYMT